MEPSESSENVTSDWLYTYYLCVVQHNPSIAGHGRGLKVIALISTGLEPPTGSAQVLGVADVSAEVDMQEMTGSSWGGCVAGQMPL